MKSAWIENGIVRDVCPGDPSILYVPEVAKLYSESVPDDAENGDAWSGRALTKRERPKPVEYVPDPAPPPGYTLDFTADEKGLHTLFSNMLEAARKG